MKNNNEKSVKKLAFFTIGIMIVSLTAISYGVSFESPFVFITGMTCLGVNALSSTILLNKANKELLKTRQSAIEKSYDHEHTEYLLDKTEKLLSTLNKKSQVYTNQDVESVIDYIETLSIKKYDISYFEWYEILNKVYNLFAIKGIETEFNLSAIRFVNSLMLLESDELNKETLIETLFMFENDDITKEDIMNVQNELLNVKVKKLK